MLAGSSLGPFWRPDSLAPSARFLPAGRPWRAAARSVLRVAIDDAPGQADERLSRRTEWCHEIDRSLRQLLCSGTCIFDPVHARIGCLADPLIFTCRLAQRCNVSFHVQEIIHDLKGEPDLSAEAARVRTIRPGLARAQP